MSYTKIASVTNKWIENGILENALLFNELPSTTVLQSIQVLQTTKDLDIRLIKESIAMAAAAWLGVFDRKCIEGTDAAKEFHKFILNRFRIPVTRPTKLAKIGDMRAQVENCLLGSMNMTASRLSEQGEFEYSRERNGKLFVVRISYRESGTLDYSAAAGKIANMCRRNGNTFRSLEAALGMGIGTWDLIDNERLEQLGRILGTVLENVEEFSDELAGAIGVDGKSFT